MEDFIFNYKSKDEINFELKSHDFVTVLGNSNDSFINSIITNNNDVEISINTENIKSENLYKMRKEIGIVLRRHLDIFVGETVRDEIIFGLENLSISKNDITNLLQSECRVLKLEKLLDKDPYSLGSSDKIKMKLLSVLIIKPKVLILDNILCDLDCLDRNIVINCLKDFTKTGGIIINLTNDVEESLFGDKIIVLHNNKLVCEGKTINVLNEEKLFKRLGIGLPFLVELSKDLMDYGLIDKYYLSNEKLVGAIWK